MPDGLTIFSRKIKSALRDFHAAEGNEVPNAGLYNDRAAALAVAHWNTEGGFTEWEGVFRFRSAMPTVVSKNGGFVGAGPGVCLWPFDFPGPNGTVFRHEGQGDFLTLNGNWNGVVRDIAFWPVYHKTSGAEIMVKGRSNQNRFDRLLFNLPYRAVHVENAVYTDLEYCVVYDPFSDGAFYVSGSPSVLSEHNEKTTFRRCNTYTSQRHAQTPELSVRKIWSAGLAVSAGDYCEVNGHILQCVQGGTTGGTAPVLPTYTLSTDRPGVQIADGTAKWGYYCRSFLAGVLIDSGGDYVTVDDCEFLQGAHALRTQNTFAGGDPAKQIHYRNNQTDHSWSHAVWFAAANKQFSVIESAMESSVLGTGLNIAAGCDEFFVDKNWFRYNNGGAFTNSAGTGSTRVVGANIAVP